MEFPRGGLVTYKKPPTAGRRERRTEPRTERRTEPSSTAPVQKARQANRSRGALTNAASRYLQQQSEFDPELTESMAETDPDFVQPKVRTEFLADRTVNLITRNRSPDIPFDRSINPYKGCEHGCIYCFARPTHAYLDLSPGLDFETKIFYKTGIVERLRSELGKPGYQVQPIAMGTNTDPYQPGEKTLRVTRQILQTLLQHKHPVSIVTKGQLLLRDLDLLSELAALNLVKVMVSVTTLNNGLKAKLEPRTASPNVRLKMIRCLAEEGIPVGAMVAPVIPAINDAELDNIVAACAANGAQDVNYILLRLPLEVVDLFEQWLQEHFPLRKDKVMNILRDTRGGKAYESKWGERMRGKGPFAELLANRFRLAKLRQGFTSEPMAALDCSQFVADPADTQLGLFN